ncbi:hypothetical protein BpHYR1_009738 [Brachionus plicatilis]|uniref:Uncharacterized protein n=1 Tax=Brachionus plicatilis TaxID=10195 RepID=A0A3M7R3P1_BRAPC|nr:hypothetical protein BpHYR1_009738 [Brachionus plicatilis]
MPTKYRYDMTCIQIESTGGFSKERRYTVYCSHHTKKSKHVLFSSINLTSIMEQNNHINQSIVDSSLMQ